MGVGVDVDVEWTRREAGAADTSLLSGRLAEKEPIDAGIGQSPDRGSARRLALWQLGVMTPGRRVPGGTQLALPLELPAPPSLQRLSEWERMLADYDTIGLTTRTHPMALLRERLGAGVVSSADLERLEHGRRVRIGGLVVARQRPGTASGVVFILLEDEYGTINLVVPPPVYERHRLTVRTEPLMLVEGKLEKLPAAGGAINVLVDTVGSIDAPDRVLAEIKDFSMLDEQVRRGLAEQTGGRGGRRRRGRRAGRRRRGFPGGCAARDELRLGAAAMTGAARAGRAHRGVQRRGAIRCRPHGHRRRPRDCPDFRAAAAVGPEPGAHEPFRAIQVGRRTRFEHGDGVAFVLVTLGFGIALPLVMLHGNVANASKQVGGVRLTAEAKTGRLLFGEHCAVCHTLGAANAIGKVGPNLDLLRPDRTTVLHTIANGCLPNASGADQSETCLGYGVMPSEVVTGQDAQDVASFVAEAAGH